MRSSLPTRYSITNRSPEIAGEFNRSFKLVRALRCDVQLGDHPAQYNMQEKYATRREGGPMHAIQSWVALPKTDEETAPHFAHHAGNDLPLEEDRGIWLRLLAGEAFGLHAKVKTHSPLFYLHVALEAASSIALPREHPERAAYLVSGAASADGQPVAPGQMIVFDGHAPAVVEASAPSVLMLLGGAPVGPRFIEWNFVSSSRERIEQAKADWRAGRMKLPDGDNKEFIPLPPDMHRSANAMS